MADDGLGVYASEELKKKEWPPGIAILEVGTSVVCYLEDISLSRNVIAMDAVRAGGKPGTIYRLTPGEMLNPPDCWRDSHGLPLPGVIALARELKGFPASFIVYGMEPLDLSYGFRLSTSVKKSLPLMISKVGEEIKRLFSIPIDDSP